MSTEVKIGIVVGLVVIAGSILFFVNQSRRPAGGDVTGANLPEPPRGSAAKTAPRDIGAAARKTPLTPPGGARTPGAARTPEVPITPPRTGETAGPVTPGGATPSGTTPSGTAPRTGAERPTPPAGPGRTETTQPGEIPPLVRGPEAASRPTTPGPERPATGATGPQPGVAPPPPRGESPPRTEPSGATPPGGQSPPRAGETPSPGPAAGPPPAVAKHTVAEGDTLWSIAAHYYGDGRLWTKLKAANPSIEGERLLVGQTLTVPPKEQAATPAEKTATTPKAGSPAKAASTEKATPAAKEKPGNNGSPTTRPAAKTAPAAKETPAKTAPGAKESPNGKAPPATAKAGPAEPKPAARRHTYVVEEGDSLVRIAREILKDENRWQEIYELNQDKISNPDVLLVGTELRLPEK